MIYILIDIQKLYDSAYSLIEINPKKSIEEYMKILRIDPEHQNANHDLAMVYICIGDFKLANKQVKEYLLKYPLDYRGYNIDGIIEYHNNNLEQAKQNFIKCIDLQGDFYGALSNLGMTCIKLNDYEESELYFNRSLSIKENSKSLFGLAVCQMLIGNYIKADYYFNILSCHNDFRKYEKYKLINNQMTINKDNMDLIKNYRDKILKLFR